MIKIRTDQPLGIEHRGHNLFVLATIMVAFAFSSFSIRLQQRFKHKHMLGYDDFAIMIAMGFDIALCTTTCVGVYFGYGMHYGGLGGHNDWLVLLLFYLQQIFYKVTLNGAKLTYLLMGLRMFPVMGQDGPPKKNVRYQVLFLISLVVMYAVASILATIFQCLPVGKIFDPKVQGHCINLRSFWYGNAGFNVAIDCLMLALPWPHIVKLNTNKLVKCGLGMMLGLGILVTIISFNRLIQLCRGSDDSDVTFGTLNSTIWTIIEANAAILCVCLPAWKTLMNTLMPKLFPNTPAEDNGNSVCNTPQGHDPVPDAHNSGFASPSGHYRMLNASQVSSAPLIAPPAPIVKRHLTRLGKLTVRTKSGKESREAAMKEEEDKINFMIEMDNFINTTEGSRIPNQEYVSRQSGRVLNASGPST